MIFITLNTSIEFFCFLAALFFLYKDKSAAWRLLIPYLLITLLCELLGIYFRKFLHLPNTMIYNLLVIAEFSSITFLFYRLFGYYRLKNRATIGWICIFAIIYITDLFKSHLTGFVSVSTTVMSVGFVIFSLLFFYQKMQEDGYENLFRSAPFWWVSGTLVFYFGTTACNLFNDYLVANEFNTFSRSIRYIIFSTLNILLYTFWVVSFICRYSQRKLSASSE